MMKEERTSLRVRPIDGEFASYLVESHSDHKQAHKVDLTAHVIDGSAHGECDCIFYQTTARPNRRHGKIIPYRKDKQGKVVKGTTDCKHISACRNHFEKTVVRPMLAQAERNQR